MTEMLKQCTKCCEVKTEDEFPRYGWSRGQGPRARCQKCTTEYNKAYNKASRAARASGRSLKPQGIAVVRSDGETFPSINEAARSTPGASVFTVRRATVLGVECAGFKWEAL